MRSSDVHASIGLFLGLLLSGAVAQASLPVPWATGLDQRHAHFELASGDSLHAWRLLSTSGASDDADSTSLGFALRQVLAWSLGDSTASSGLPETASETLAALQTWHGLDGAALPRPMPSEGLHRLAWASLALSRQDYEAAGRALQAEVPAEFESLRWTLTAALDLATGDEVSARRALERVANDNRENAQLLRDRAALQLANFALADQDTNAAQKALARVGADGPLAARAEFLGLLLDGQERENSAAWTSFAARHPASELAREALLRAADLELATGESSAALAVYRDVLRSDRERGSWLEALAQDGSKAAAAMWDSADASLLTPTDDDIDQLAATVVARWFADFRVDAADLQLSARAGSSAEALDLLPTDADQAENARHARSLRAAIFRARDLANELEEIRQLEASRRRQLDRADAERDSAETAMREIEDTYSTSASLADSTRARWLIMRDRAIDRLRQRGAHLSEIARQNAALSDRIDLLYLQGPMARLEKRDLTTIPLPEALVREERSLRGDLDSESADFAALSESSIRRSVEQVLLPQLFARLDSVGTRNSGMRTRQNAIDEWLISSRAAIDSSQTRSRAEGALASARLQVASAAEAWQEFRETRALARVAVAIDELRRDGEAPLYGAAVSSLELGFALDDAAEPLEVARSRMNEFLDLYPRSPARADLRYRLADLLLVTARADFQRRMGRYLDEGATNPALMPLWKVDEPIALYESILEEDPDFDRTDRVLFQLGMLHADLVDGQAEPPLARLVAEHPDSPLLAAAHLRLGELAFEQKRWLTAAEHLERAAASDDLSTRVVALYKLGWSRYALDQFDAAADRFLDLLDIYAGDEEHPQLGFDIATESRDLLVRSLARSGAAEAFTRSFAERGPRPYQAQVLLELGELLDEYALAKARDDVDQLLLETFPTHPATLSAAQRHLSRVDDDHELTRLADRFLVGGDWANVQSSDSLVVAADHFARGIFELRAQGFHRDARGDESDATGWNRALDAYEDLLQRWPQHEMRPRWQLLAADCAAAEENWSDAIDYANAAAITDSISIRRDAMWQGVALSDAWYRSTQPDSSSVGADSLATRLVAAMDSYRDSQPLDPRGVNLQWRSAQLQWAHAHLEDAATRLHRFAAEHPMDSRSDSALRSRAEIFYSMSDFDRASSAFSDAAELARTAGKGDVAELENWVVHCEYRGAQSVAEDSTRSATEIAERWERVATTWPDYVDADKAWYNAGSAWPDGSRSRAAFRVVWTQYPQSSLRLDAARNLATSHEENGELAEAAEVLRQLARSEPRPDDAADALLHAVDLYEKAGRELLRQQSLDEYLALFPGDLQTKSAVLTERSLQELDALEGKSVESLLGSTGSSLAALLTLSTEHADLVPTSLQARVEFLKAEELRQDYMTLSLRQPLEPSIAKKQAALTKLLAAYSAVGERHIAPWAQAAAYRSGEALMAFGDALKASERPSDLGGEDLLAYDEVLEDQSWNFFDRGEDAWKQLLKSGAPDEAEEWMQRARDQFYQRTSERYLHMPSFDFPLVRASAPPVAASAR